MSASQPPMDFGCSVGFAGGVAPAGGSGHEPTRSEWQALGTQLTVVQKLLQEMLIVSREQLEIARRAEARQLKLIQNQREELQQWLGPNQLGGRCGKLHTVLRDTLGQALGEVAEYIEDHDDDLADNEFVRSELVDRYGSQLNHLSAIYGLMKRLSQAEAEMEAG